MADLFYIDSTGRRKPLRPLRDRFEAKVDRDGPVPAHRPDLGQCWRWLGTIQGLGCPRGGYGMIKRGGVGSGNASPTYAHIVSYELYVGPIPEGLTIDHLCHNRGCVNPAHLEPVTLSENLRRRMPRAA